ncbi:gamma-glutamyl-gamma-aminobutyrate hydrolase family protein [Shouchella sp. JSM 1781072]|uniref:gamma-glutamyl-gamma-aminobutyrate hydrolase family protein n=1 Tax=Bacillaceae TaxID=186817 RepID=UPI0020D1B508|nr:gamma-glutamyl-gamma-aminobutyrate hydrolase family protein [Alkalihalobacillus sp. LMS6]UTR05074.1 gamma-glutamyl-gamma-aminobutyrate hydrolase family protein [Alkalihalobacillus sp. LMS6]
MLTIGITSSIVDAGRLSTALDNIAAINGKQVLPFVLPNIEPTKAWSYVKQLDGVLMTGGGDINPTLFHEDPHPQLGSITPERDLFEMALAKAALAEEKPVLAICRGMQILNIAAGGDMYQDLPSQFQSELIQHQQRAPREYGSHQVQMKDSSILASIVGTQTMFVNSFHHQAVRQVSSPLAVVGWTNDGVIEAIEHETHPFQVGVQWHPENMKDEHSKKLFQGFLKACESWRSRSKAN